MDKANAGDAGTLVSRLVEWFLLCVFRLLEIVYAFVQVSKLTDTHLVFKEDEQHP